MTVIEQESGVTTLVASQSVRHYPWLVQSRKQYSILTSGDLRQVGAPFRLWGENARRPVTAAVFRCGRCSGHTVMWIENVKAGAETCRTCSKTVHGMARRGDSRAYKCWQHLLTRYRHNEIVEYSWLHPRTGVTAFLSDVGECPGDNYYLCRRTEAGFWVRGNVYWRKALPGIWQTTADDAWMMRSGDLHQVGATMRLSGRLAVYFCHRCNRHVIESRIAIIKCNHDRCADCREAEAGIRWRGERLSVFEWAARTGIPASVLHDRLRNGWTAERMLTTPPKPYRGRHAVQASDPIQDT